MWSPSNRYTQMKKKFQFYEKHGAEEYYIIYPEFPAHLEGWLCRGDHLVEIEEMNGHVSPRLGFRFSLVKGQVAVFGPDGRQLRKPDEIAQELAAERTRADRAAADRDAEHARAEEQMNRAEQERERAERLAAKLRELGLDPDAK